MFTEDTVLRMIRGAVAALATALGLRQAGRVADALQVLLQASGELVGMPPEMLDLLDDNGLVDVLTVNGVPDLRRLSLLADLSAARGDCLLASGQSAAAASAFASALRFALESARDAETLAADPARIERLLARLQDADLPPATLSILGDYYDRIGQKRD